jgi:hypothetical protein
MKVRNTDGYTQENNSRASVSCTGGYQLNMREKTKTLATCKCNVENQCKWVFGKGDVMCVKCQKPSITYKNGRALIVVNNVSISNVSFREIEIIKIEKKIVSINC